MFQSSLELSPECNGANPTRCQKSHACFNPHSSFRPSATSSWPVTWPSWDLSFNPHSSFRPSATRRALGDAMFRQEVSILTRAFARVQLSIRYLGLPSSSSFNPHSSFRPSATLQPAGLLPRRGVSILTRAFARVQLEFGWVERNGEFVSILTRAFARVQRVMGGWVMLAGRAFQSSLELSPECNLARLS